MTAEDSSEDGASASGEPQPEVATVAEDTAAFEEATEVTQNAPTEGRVLGETTPSSRGGLRPAPSLGEQIASISRQYEGAPYRWAGSSPAGFDCSGFTMYVYGKAGISIPRDHRGQLNTGKQVDVDDLQPGDILFFNNTYSAGLSHSGIYLGDNQFIHAETEQTGVVISPLRGSNWGRNFAGASRPYQ